MSFQDQPDDDAYESADAYGRNEGCFLNHRGPPFSVRDHIGGIQHTFPPEDFQDLISQSGLELLDLHDAVGDPDRFEAGGILATGS
jgi:hypothetical protein